MARPEPCGSDGKVTSFTRHPRCRSIPSNRWFASDVPNQFDRGGIEARRHCDRLVLFGLDYRIELHVSFEDLAAGGVNASNRRAELRVRIGCYVFREKIDQPPISLEQA